MLDDSIVLVADGDERLRGFLAVQLDADGATVRVATDAAQARTRAATYRPDVLVLGVLETPTAAVALLREIRAESGGDRHPAPDVPVIMLLSSRDELSTLRAYDAGVDDVAPRPIAYPLLRARLRVLLGQTGSRSLSGPATLRSGVVELDEASREVRLRGEPLALSAKEFELLRCLMADPARVWTKAELMRSVWGSPVISTTRTLDSHACRLRAKLGAHGDRFVVNVWGVGYRLTDNQARQLGVVA